MLAAEFHAHDKKEHGTSTRGRSRLRGQSVEWIVAVKLLLQPLLLLLLLLRLLLMMLVCIFPFSLLWGVCER